MEKIILVDDHALFREGLKLLIETEGIGVVVAEAENGKVFIDLLAGHTPDLVILDIEMPVMGGLEAMREAKKLQPNIKILILTMLSERANYFDMVSAGAMGFVLKTAGKKDLEKAIKTLIGGECFFSNELLRQIIVNVNTQQQIKPKLSTVTDHGLTNNEMEVLRYLCQGLTVSQIAEKIFRSVKAVEARRSLLLKKTNTPDTINLILFAIKNGLVDI
ncbi:MAG: response regulator transcription factor [Paludibacter sp.]|nr:response regulator transcription factor [Paludibacter sp.]